MTGEPSGLRALTVKQPWAWAIIAGGKDVENRTRPFPATVPLGSRIAIHAGTAWDKAGMTFLLQQWSKGAHYSPVGMLIGSQHHSAIIGSVEVVGCHRCADWDSCGWGQANSWHWELANPIPCEPIPCRGALGLWRVPAEIESQLLANQPERSV